MLHTCNWLTIAVPSMHSGLAVRLVNYSSNIFTDCKRHSRRSSPSKLTGFSVPVRLGNLKTDIKSDRKRPARLVNNNTVTAENIFGVIPQVSLQAYY